MSHFLGDDDDDFVLAGVEAYNNFLFEEFCAPDPKRLDRPGADPVARHRHRGRRAAQGEGARREGRAHLELAVGRREPLAPTTTRSGPRRSTRACRSRSTSTSSAARSARAARKAAAKPGNQLYDMTSEATRAKAIGGMSHVFSMAAGAITDDDLHRRVRAVPRAAGLLDRDRRRLDPALPRVPRRPLLAQPRRGATCRSREPPSFYWYRNNAATLHHRPHRASRCATASASTT